MRLFTSVGDVGFVLLQCRQADSCSRVCECMNVCIVQIMEQGCVFTVLAMTSEETYTDDV